MLIPSVFLPNLIQLSQPASLLTSLGFRYHSPSLSFLLLPPRLFLLHKLTSTLHTFLVLLTLLQFLISFSSTSRPFQMISSFALIILLFCTTTVQVYSHLLHPSIYLINQLISTSLHISSLQPTSPPLDTKERLILILCPLLHYSAMFVPFAFTFGVILSMPCLPSNLLYSLHPQCTSSPSSIPLPIPFFLLLNLWLWSYGVQCAVFVVILLMLGASSLRGFLKFYLHRLLSDPLHAPTFCLIYRRIQLLTHLFNSIHQSKILVPLIFTVTSHQVFSVYGAIKFNGQLNLISYLLFLILGSQGVTVIMGMFTGLADVYTMSRRVKAKLQREHRWHRYLRRFHQSCQLIRIRFGAVNFIDSFTPLGFENFAVVQTTNMLMVN